MTQRPIQHTDLSCTHVHAGIHSCMYEGEGVLQKGSPTQQKEHFLRQYGSTGMDTHWFYQWNNFRCYRYMNGNLALLLKKNFFNCGLHLSTIFLTLKRCLLHLKHSLFKIFILAISFHLPTLPQHSFLPFNLFPFLSLFCLVSVPRDL